MGHGIKIGGVSTGKGLIPLEMNEQGYVTKASFNGKLLPAGLFCMRYPSGSSIYTSDIFAGNFLTELELGEGSGIGTYSFCSNEIIKKIIPKNNIIGELGDYALCYCTNLDLSEIDILTINGEMGNKSMSGGKDYAKWPSKIKMKGSLIENQAFESNYNMSYKTKFWISNNCTTINADSASLSPFYNSSGTEKIYCEASSKPSGWGAYWNSRGSYSNSVTVMWGVTESAFNAL